MLKKGAAMGLAMAVSAFACEQPAECEGRCGTAVIVTVDPIETLFPPAAVRAGEYEVIDQIFTKLADLTPDLNTQGDAGFTPKLARAWRFEDDRTLSFDIHPDATWHDGVPVTADDVVFTYETYRDPATNASAGLLLDRIASVEARDERTVVFRFTRPYVEQFFDATHHMRILPKHVLDTVPAERLASHPFGRQPVGNGPYRLANWVEGEYVELEADTAFFLGDPGIARLIWRRFPDVTSSLSPLVTEEADLTGVIVGRPNVERARELEHVRVIPYPSPYYSYMGFNFHDPGDATRPHPLFGNRDLRRAMAMAVDRAALARAVIGDYGVAPLAPAGPMVRTHHRDLPQIPFDTSGARETLLALGWRDSDGDGTLDRNGRPLRFEVLVPAESGDRQTAAVQIQAQLQRLGVRMEINQVAGAVMIERAQSGRFDAFMMSWGTDPSPSTITEIWSREGGLNWQGYADARFDSLVEDARNATAPGDEDALWREAYSQFNDDAPLIYTYSPSMFAGIHERFENVTIRPDQWAATLWTWRVRPGAMIARDRLSGS